MSNKNLYSEYIHVSADLDEALKRCFMNHLVLYNYSLSLLYDKPYSSFKDIMKQVDARIEEKNTTPIIHIALMNELYYQYKKFKRNIRVQKLVTDIQYFTFFSNGYNCRSMDVSEDRKSITLNDLPGVITLDKPLPELNDEEVVYINISYSNAEDKYKISMYKSLN